MTTRRHAAWRIALAATALASLSHANAQDGLYDDRFGNYLPGRTLYQGVENDSEQAYTVSVMPDGRLVLAGGYASIRLSASGVPDSSFGNQAFGVDGMFAVRPGGDATGFLTPSAVVREADGKLVFAGSVESAADLRFHYAACRTSADGVPDPSYGSGGCTVYSVEADSQEYGTAAAIDASGRLVLGGWGYFSFGQKMVVIRLDANGHLDTTFGTNGRTVLLRFGEIAGVETTDTPGAITIDTSGRILVAGSAGPINHSDFAIARLGADGRLDTSFGDGGARLVDVAGQDLYDAASAIALQRSGRIIVAGYAGFPNAARPGMTAVGLTSGGDLDASFGSQPGYVAVWPYGESSYAYTYGLAIQQDGRIVMAGAAQNTDNGGVNGEDMVVARLMPDGDALDGSFATFGVFTGGFDLGNGTDSLFRNDQLRAVALQDNRIVAVGYARGDGANASFAAIRLTQDRLFVDGFDLP